MGTRGPLDLAFVGSGNAFAPQRCWSGFFLNGRYAFDAPPTALMNLKKLGADLAAIDVILLSHFHADHYFGIPFLLLEYAYRTRRRTDLTIVGPPGVEENVEKLVELGYRGLAQHDFDFRRRYVEITDGATGEVNGLAYRAVQVKHAEGQLECFGYQVTTGGRTLGYTGDTSWCDGLLTLAQGVEVLVADCTYPSGRDQPEHLSFEEIRDLRQQIDPNTTMILTHLDTQQDNGGLSRVHVAQDLSTFSLLDGASPQLR